MSKRFKSTQLFVMALLLSIAGQASSFEPHLRGFGTASLSCFSSDDADYITNNQPKGPGISGRCDTGLDSLLGLQFDAEIAQQFEFGLQIIADRNADASYDPDVSVAQLRWHASDALTFRIGRMPTPTFLHSEDRQVRFAMPWVRPPLEVYGLIPTLYNDGAEFVLDTQWNNWHLEWQGGISRFDFEIPELITKGALTDVETKNMYLNVLIRNPNTLIKLGYFKFKVTAPSTATDALFDALRMFGGPSGAELASDLEIKNSDSHLISIGIRHETNNWLAMSEFAYRTIDSYLRDQYGAYATIGYHFDSWMPYVTLARRWSKGPSTDDRAGAFTQSVEDLLAFKFDSTSISFGLSRELSERMTLKMQADWIQPDDNSRGLFINNSADYDLDNPDSDWLLTLSLDFVF